MSEKGVRPEAALHLPLGPAWLRSYNRGWLRPDLLAGLTVAAFSVPESMAYATLAGLEPQHGLYASVVAMLLYTFFGTSRQLSVGVTSALSIMVAGTLVLLAGGDAGRYLGLASLTALVAGGIAVAAGLFRLGFIVNFISHSVLVGFSAGAALYIAASQLSKLFGIEGVEGGFFPRVANVVTNLDQTNLTALGFGLAGLAALLLLERFLPRLPGALIVVIVSILIVSIANLSVEVTGEIPRGLPTLGLPRVGLSDLSDVVTLAFACFLLSYIEGMSAARTFAVRHNNRISLDQELLANGAINLGAGFVQGFPVGGSMSRSAVNDGAGARTPLARRFAGVFLLVVVLFLTGFLHQSCGADPGRHRAGSGKELDRRG
jgi:MFS superfamily sulfate permease-like transporter